MNRSSMNSKQHTLKLQSTAIDNLSSLNIPAKIMPYIGDYLNDCNLHQMKNLTGNISEVKKFIEAVIGLAISNSKNKGSEDNNKTKNVGSKLGELAHTLVINIGEKIRRGFEFFSRDPHMTCENVLLLCDKVKGKFTNNNDYITEIIKTFKAANKGKTGKIVNFSTSGYGSDYGQAT